MMKLLQQMTSSGRSKNIQVSTTTSHIVCLVFMLSKDFMTLHLPQNLALKMTLRLFFSVTFQTVVPTLA